MRSALILVVGTLLGFVHGCDVGTPTVRVSDVSSVLRDPVHWFYYLATLHDAQGQRYYFGACCGQTHQCSVVMRQLLPDGSSRVIIEERVRQRVLETTKGKLKFTWQSEIHPDASLTLSLSAEAHVFEYQRGVQRLSLQMRSLGHSLWWHNKRRPSPDAKLLDKYYGVDDVSAFSGVVRDQAMGTVRLHGTGVYEMMSIDSPDTNRAWRGQNWFIFTSPGVFGLVLDFDNYFDGFLCLGSHAQALRLQSASFDFGEPDAQGYPRSVEVHVHTVDGMLTLTGKRFYRDSVYRVPILIGDREFQDLHFDIQGIFTNGRGQTIPVRSGYAVDQVLVPVNPHTLHEAYPVQVR